MEEIMRLGNPEDGEMHILRSCLWFDKRKKNRFKSMLILSDNLEWPAAVFDEMMAAILRRDA
jgi:hypothetical protein